MKGASKGAKIQFGFGLFHGDEGEDYHKDEHGNQSLVSKHGNKGRRDFGYTLCKKKHEE